ncbi:hypothetical protein [Altericista sp. CCNU0014]|uniref:hypothetical protein n=1 Tax=Altericista sp. CCNU0014 TaxID=3082949 RepID=UPI003850DAC9
MQLRNFFRKTQKAPIVKPIINQTSDEVDEETIDRPKQPTTEWEMYNDLLTMNLFANYYPHVFPDQNMFR